MLTAAAIALLILWPPLVVWASERGGQAYLAWRLRRGR